MFLPFMQTCSVRVLENFVLCSQLDAGERALVRGMRTQVERMMNRHPEGCDEVEEEDDVVEEEEEEDEGDEAEEEEYEEEEGVEEDEEEEE